MNKPQKAFYDNNIIPVIENFNNSYKTIHRNILNISFKKYNGSLIKKYQELRADTGTTLFTPLT